MGEGKLIDKNRAFGAQVYIFGISVKLIFLLYNARRAEIGVAFGTAKRGVMKWMVGAVHRHDKNALP